MSAKEYFAAVHGKISSDLEPLFSPSVLEAVASALLNF